MDEAADWWEANRTAAPDAIAEDVARALMQIAAHPAAGEPVLTSRRRGVRRMPLRRVRYFIYYRASEDEVEILAFWHASRGSPPPI